MFISKNKLEAMVQKARDEGLHRGYKLGYLMGKVERSNRTICKLDIPEAFIKAFGEGR